jgi:hypothetical protein
MLEIKKAVRRALPMQLSFYGPSGSGKTFSALLFAAGLAGPGGKVCVIDTERGRASLYADNKKILAALPGGFDVVEIDSPYHPRRFIEAIDAVENAKYNVCLIDSSSDAWDGPGGCTDIAEENKKMWTIPKLWNKRLMTRIQLSDMHVICLLKAQEKTKIIDKKDSDSGKQEYVSLGIQPICEKNFFYPMLVGFSVDPKTHISTATKLDDNLLSLFSEPRLITKADGEHLRAWNQGGKPLEDNEQLRKRARSAADEGMESYKAFFGACSPAQKAALKPIHEELKFTAEQVDLAELPQNAEVEA